MSKIKVSEAFFSLQGEGKYMGAPSVFLRTFGCNFTCGGFGMPKGQKSEERMSVNPIHFSKYEDLPLVHTGCDSYPSWDPRFKDLSPFYEVPALAEHLQSLCPYGEWNDNHLVITGGEPLLGWQRAYPELLHICVTNGLKYLTFETNGTQELSKDLERFLTQWEYDLETIFSVSPKLGASGEKWENAILPDVVAGYQENFETYLKFVVSDESDIDEVDLAVKQYEDAGFYGKVYLMPVGGTEKLYYKNNATVAKLAMDRGYYFTPRLQIDIWGNSWGT